MLQGFVSSSGELYKACLQVKQMGRHTLYRVLLAAYDLKTVGSCPRCHGKVTCIRSDYEMSKYINCKCGFNFKVSIPDLHKMHEDILVIQGVFDNVHDCTRFCFNEDCDFYTKPAHGGPISIHEKSPVLPFKDMSTLLAEPIKIRTVYREQLLRSHNILMYGGWTFTEKLFFCSDCAAMIDTDEVTIEAGGALFK